MKKKNWTAENIPNQTGKIVIITGSSSGVGYEAARVLTDKGATVVIAVRSLEKGNAAADKILVQNKGADVKVLKLDLGDLASVREFAEEFKKNYTRLDLLINNAGVMVPPFSKTKDGFELQFGTNHLGHFALTAHLLDVLTNTVRARIVNVSSSAHRFGKLNFDDLAWDKRSYSARRAYSDSKLANLYFTFELDRKLKENKLDLLTTAAHPGLTTTELSRHGGLTHYITRLFGQEVSMGALPVLRAATEKELKGGEFYSPDDFLELGGYPVKVEPSKLSKDEKIANKLWAVSEKLIGVKFEFNKKSPLPMDKQPLITSNYLEEGTNTLVD